MLFSNNSQKTKFIFRLFVLCMLLVIPLLIIWIGNTGQNTHGKRLETGETVLISDSSDPYYSLAEKISNAEDMKIVGSIHEAINHDPNYIILIAAPDNLKEERLLSIGKSYLEQDNFVPLGIITGSTIEQAENLWDRRDSAQNGQDYLGTDYKKGQLIFEPVLLDISETGSGEKIELNKESLMDTLQKADYFYWARHVHWDKWFWNTVTNEYDENSKLFAKDLPELDSIVIYTPSCGSFQPWKEESIAIGFVDNGAAAYVGHMHSPIGNGFMMWQGLYVPGQLSWKEFPLGVIAQVQNRMTAKTSHNTPLFFMLGDPRIFLSAEQPYQINSDKEKGNHRILNGESSQSGVLAVKIDNGARYDYIKINNVNKASEKDLFYNNKLQSLDLGPDKYILFFHQGGSFELELFHTPPFGWVFADAFVDALDHSWVIYNVAGSPISILFLIILLAIISLKKFKHKKSIKNDKVIFIFASTFSLAKLIYLHTRINNYSVSADVVVLNTLMDIYCFIGIFSTVSAGLIMMKSAKNNITKFFGLIFAAFPQFMLTGFGFIITSVTNITFYIKNPVPLILWNYNMFGLRWIVLLSEIIVIYVFYEWINRNNSFEKYEDRHQS